MKKPSHPPPDVFSISVQRPPLPLPTSDKGLHYRQAEESPLKNTDMPYIVMVIQSVIIFITLSAFILYVFSPRGMPQFSPTSAPSFTVHFETHEPLIFPQPVPKPPAPPSTHSHSMLAKFKRAAVVSDHGICSEIGRRILTKGGNAVDSAIATLFCVGVTNPQSSGIGGGFFMQIYNKESGKCTTINARETAPRGIGKTNEDLKVFSVNNNTRYGWKSIGVPGEIKGFWRAFNDFGSGKIKWAELIEPTIELCRDGIPVSEYLAAVLASDVDVRREIVKNHQLHEMFWNHNTTNYYKEGEIMKRPALANTLRRLADAADPTELFYRGDMAQTFVKEIQEGGGFLSLEDLDDYEPAVEPSVTSTITDNISQCGPPPPSSWVVTQLIVKIMEELYPPPRCVADTETVLFYHRLIEAEKFAYAQRTILGDKHVAENLKKILKLTKLEDGHWARKLAELMAAKVAELTDPETAKAYAARIDDAGPRSNETYQPVAMKEDHGTSHVSVIDEAGNAVAVTSTINLLLGSNVASSLGVIWNDQMDDFSLPNQTNAFGFAYAPNNLIAAGKTPMSSMSPTIIYDNRSKRVRVVIGTTGGSKIIQGVASVVVRSLLFGQTIKEAIDAPQIFHQNTPDYVQYEADFPKDILAALRAKGHELQLEQNMHSTTHAIFVDEEKGYIFANSDKRSKVHMHPDGY